MSPTQQHPNSTMQDELPQKYSPRSSLNLFSEEERLKTFDNWTSSALAPEDLARNGFYYSGISDLTRCVFCGLEVADWVSGDSAADDHKRYSPDCDFVRGRPCGNITKGSTLSTSPSPSSPPLSASPPGYDTCGFHGFLIRPHSGPEQGVIDLINDFEQIGVTRTEGPVNRSYATLESRLATFHQWPASSPVRPEQLAAAGFYSDGCSDHALCFYCGGGLKDWEEGDDPWIEHARWFSKCGFVTLQKGREFVSQACLSGPAVLPVSTVNELLNDETAGQDVVAQSEDVVGCSTRHEPTLPEDKCELEICKVCYIADRTILLIPCGHFVVCAGCASALSACPVCRRPFKGTIRAYLS